METGRSLLSAVGTTAFVRTILHPAYIHKLHRMKAAIPAALKSLRRKIRIGAPHVSAAAIGSRFFPIALLAASIPCFGAKTKAIKKKTVCRVTMQPPVAPLRK